MLHLQTPQINFCDVSIIEMRRRRGKRPGSTERKPKENPKEFDNKEKKVGNGRPQQ